MTAQVYEKLVIEDSLFYMCSCPELPWNHPRIVEFEGWYDATCPPIVYSTACWRGYIGTWAILGDRFFLTAVVGKRRLVGDEPLFADWVTGTLRVPNGELIQYVHMGFASVHQAELHIRVEHGIVVGTRTVDNTNGVVDVEALIRKRFAGFVDRFPRDEDE